MTTLCTSYEGKTFCQIKHSFDGSRDKMKILIRVGVLLVIALFIFYYADNRVKENKLLEAPVKQGTAIPIQDKLGEVIPQTSRPSSGLSVFVGESVDTLIVEKGAPSRIEPSSFGYDWWVYNGEEKLMVGVTDDGFVNQLYTTELLADVMPFKIGQDIAEVYQFTIVESEINVEIGENIYTFSLNGDDLQSRLLILYKELYAQLYVDRVNGKLEAIRFIDPTTLVLHQPYEMTYMGQLPVSILPSSDEQVKIDQAAEKQMIELTNLFRIKHDVAELKKSASLNQLAKEHSKTIALENHLTEESVMDVSLPERLKALSIENNKAGENVASNYIDAIEAVHGWHNSPAHRKILLDDDFTHLGTGAYGNVYTQILIATTVEVK